MFLSRFVIAVVCAVSASAATAHEYWLEAPAYQVQPGAEMTTDLRNGQLFDGAKLPYFPNRTNRFDLSFEGKVVPVAGRLGDIPALRIIAPPRDGLLTVVHEASPTSLVYDDWETFVGFTEHKDFKTAVAEHQAAGYPQDHVRERYSRYSKALIAVGDGRGNDSAMGMETELTAITNPYDADFNDQMEIALTYQQAPRQDVQIEVYERDADKQVTVTKYRTDDNGHATFPVVPGMTYMVDSVVLRPAPDVGKTKDSPQWESLWASLTFAVPQK
ncbi:MAG: DUF4198 domain-containing protein [Sulfitobacter sp.]|jgi:uncharacterized protein DUF4198|uniref:DUF4198 domain-containing protein n=1 Tax=Sulfitobacter sp. TaxID=1903071 RepID=UPI000C1082ED|nr:hypothetical protein [Roseobacter sp.]PHR07415.1 MAG: hypothetical protein COB29_08835 [Sulfitobacter sp.]|tara:strand:+ start:672 stop:1490 length:819 start_codon:yes stop_codon:yes gene_type:complete